MTKIKFSIVVKLLEGSILTVCILQYITPTHTELEELRTQLTLGKSESQSKRKELLKSESKNHRLKEELRALQNHVTSQMVSKAELEKYKKVVEEKVCVGVCVCVWGCVCVGVGVGVGVCAHVLVCKRCYGYGLSVCVVCLRVQNVDCL